MLCSTLLFLSTEKVWKVFSLEILEERTRAELKTELRKGKKLERKDSTILWRVCVREQRTCMRGKKWRKVQSSEGRCVKQVVEVEKGVWRDLGMTGWLWPFTAHSGHRLLICLGGVTKHLGSHRAAWTGRCERYRSTPTWSAPPWYRTARPGRVQLISRGPGWQILSKEMFTQREQKAKDTVRDIRYEDVGGTSGL